MTYNVFGGTLNLALSINQSIQLYSAYDNVFTWLRDEATKALAKTIINKKTYRSQ